VPRKLGQHFLADRRSLDRIAAAACPEPGAVVLEIGAGAGALTGPLLRRAARVIAIERDETLVARLGRRFPEEPRLEIVAGDALEIDLARWGRVSVAGNLPYYITSPIIERILKLGGLVERAVLLVQKEVAERLTASPGSRNYGFLTVQTRLFSRPELLFSVPPSAFRPPPKVQSAVVRLTPVAVAESLDTAGFLRFAGLCFRQKRKTLRNNLLGAYAKENLESLPEGRLRAEQIDVARLIELYATVLGTSAQLR